MSPLFVAAIALTLTGANSGALKIDLPGLEGVYTVGGSASTQRSATIAPPGQGAVTGAALRMTGQYLPGVGYCGEAQVDWDADLFATLRSPEDISSHGDAEVQFFGQEIGFDLTDLFVRFQPEAFLQSSLTVDGVLVRVEGCDAINVTSPAILVVEHAELIVYSSSVPVDRTTWGELKVTY